MSTPEPRCVAVQHLDGVAIVIIDDGKANAISFQFEREVSGALQKGAERGDALILAGRPGRFCAGFDLSELLSGPDAAVALMTGGMDLVLRLLSYPRPVVAACTGHAIAGGALALLGCDVRIGLDGPFKIGFSEVGAGVPLPSFAAVLARERLDPRRLVLATLGAQIYDPAGAVEVGFLDRVVAAGVVEAATEEAQRLGAFPVEAYRSAKQAARRDLIDRLGSARRDDEELIAAVLGTGSG